MRKFFLSVIFALFTICGKAYDFEINGFYYKITSLSDLTVALTCGEATKDVYGNETPTHPYVGNIIIPGNVEYLGKTFTVTSIESSALLNSTLETLTIPESVLSAIVTASTIEKLIIEDSNLPLSELRVSSVEEAYIGRNVSDYWSYSFSGSNIKKVSFGNNVTSIGNEAFSSCVNLTTVTLSNSITNIGKNAFKDCSKLNEISGNGVEVLQTAAFCNCIALKNFSFPNLKTIENGDSQWGTYRWGVFQGCTTLRNVILPQGLSRIGTMAFMDCESLETITLPASLVSIGDNYAIERSSVFANCSNLKTITVNGLFPISIGETTFDAQTYMNATLKVASGAKEKYSNAENWKNFFTIQEDTSIDDNVFSIIVNGCSSESYYGGYVEIGDKKITNSNTTVAANKGDKMTLRFISNDSEKYELGIVKVNGQDVTDDVVNNELTIDVVSNMTVDIEWNYAVSNPVLLTIKQAENGCTKMEVNEWDTYKFYIEPSVGWKLHSVTFNGDDITSRVGTDGSLKLKEISESSVLSITFESSNTAVNNIENSKIKIYGNGNDIVVAGVNANELINIYNEAGLQVKSVRTISDTMAIPVEKGHIYIVKLKDKVVKIAI